MYGILTGICTEQPYHVTSTLMAPVGQNKRGVLWLDDLHMCWIIGCC